MPTIFSPADLKTTRASGTARATLADRAMLGSDALQVERLTLDASAKTPSTAAPDGEHFLYVIRGGGTARVGSQSFTLEPESMLWLEAGDEYSIESGAEGLEVLLCRAPAQR